MNALVKKVHDIVINFFLMESQCSPQVIAAVWHMISLKVDINTYDFFFSLISCIYV